MGEGWDGGDVSLLPHGGGRMRGVAHKPFPPDGILRAFRSLSYDALMTIDPLITAFDRALRTLAGVTSSTRPNPAGNTVDGPLTPDERRHAAGLMRINHTGEICAQALYEAQALAARDADARSRLMQAAREEEDHLAWTQQRLAELGSRTSLANPLWYAGSFAIGFCA